jgi:hypothetical protein
VYSHNLRRNAKKNANERHKSARTPYRRRHAGAQHNEGVGALHTDAECVVETRLQQSAQTRTVVAVADEVCELVVAQTNERSVVVLRSCILIVRFACAAECRGCK